MVFLEIKCCESKKIQLNKFFKSDVLWVKLRMKNIFRKLIIGQFLLLIACHVQKGNISEEKVKEPLADLESGFLIPPDSIQTSVYWYWVSDNISKEGVIKDLYAMKKVGINRAFIGNIAINATPYGKVKLFSEEWWDILHTALRTATKLNIEIGIFNSPGWSQSGGPWIKPSQAMRYLTSSEHRFDGPLKVNAKLPEPTSPFQDVRVIAFKTPKNYQSNIADLKPKISSSSAIENLNLMFDQDTITSTSISAKDSVSIVFDIERDFVLRSITVVPDHYSMYADIKVLANINGSYEKITDFSVDRKNVNLNVGFKPYAPISISVPATTSKKFRVVISKVSPTLSIKELELSSSPKVERYSEKSLAKMFPSPLPYWNEYQWPGQPVFDDPDLMINPNEVIDISQYMDLSGVLKWDVPVGEWVVLRTGMTPTGVTNAPASKEGTGLEVDKMSKAHIASHFDSFLGEIIRRIPTEDRKTWKVAVQDSYETGGQNWTDGMIQKFQDSYNYNPLPYLPTLQGKIVGSGDMSDRFLWDFRRLIADRVAYDYVAGLREVSNKNGLSTWLENYGHWGFPGEFLQYGGQSDEIGGEFWSEGKLGNIENRAASSAAHIYGKTKVSAESFTAAGKTFGRYPEMMKQRGDRFFTEGINNTLLHLYIQQPDDRVPGINSWFGNEFNRNNTWFNYMDLFVNYLKRCNLMLQQGKYVADVAYFIGEDAPKMTGVTDPELPKGYSYDYINAEVIKRITKVENGRIYLADGMNYGILVLPKLETMRPELLQKISDLVLQGANILGPAPIRSPSLENYPIADKKVKELAEALWGDIDGNDVKSHRFGKGLVMSNMDMQSALSMLNIVKDVDLDNAGDSVLYIHRTLKDGEIYFLSNQSNKEVSVTPAFRTTNKQPELWDAINGSRRYLPEFKQNGETTTIPVTLQPLQSAFIVFRKEINPSQNAGVNFPKAESVHLIDSPWTVQFDPTLRGPEKPIIFNQLTDWTKRPEENIKYYSGTAVYHNTFKVEKPKMKEQLFLNIGEVKGMARIKLNGEEIGGVWTSPWEVNITKYVRSGANDVEISVVNTWMNRLIGDSKLPQEQRKTFTSVNPYTPDSPLGSSGLKGPVRILEVNYNP